MKKTIFALLLLLLPVSLAEADGKSIAIEAVYAEDSEMTVSFSSEGFSDDEWITFLTSFSESPDAEEELSDLISINQFKKSDSPSLRFPLNGTYGTYQVKMGGDGISSPTVLSVTLEESMGGNIRFLNTNTDLFIGEADENVLLRDENQRFFNFEPNKKYLAASASVPEYAGYTIKEYGIRINGTDYSAKVELTETAKYGMLFHGSGISDGKKITAFPYMVYEKENEEDVTVFGNSVVRIIGTNDNSAEDTEDTGDTEDKEDNKEEDEENNYIFYDDFTQSSDLPAEYSVSGTAYGTVEVAVHEVLNADGTYSEKNCLKIEDNISDSVGSLKYAGVSVKRSFEETDGKYAAELRMKFIEKSNPYMSMSFCINSGSSNITKLIVNSAAGELVTTSEMGETANFGALESDVWYTVRVVADPASEVYQMCISSEQLDFEEVYIDLGYASSEGAADNTPDNITFGSQVYDGIVIIDYMSLEKNPDDLEYTETPFVHPEVLRLAPVTATPVNHKLEDEINICLNGEYLYPASPLYVKNGEIMIYIKNAALLFGGSYSSDGELLLNGSKFVFTEGEAAAYINGSAVSLPQNVEITDGRLYIPLIFTLSNSGYSPQWQEAEQTLYIIKEAE